MPMGMRSRSDSRAWTIAFAAGLALRPILIVPMAPSGPLGGSVLLPIGLAAVFVLSGLLAAGLFVEGLDELVIAFGTFTALAGVPVAVIGAWAGLPGPWPLALVGYNLALAAVGVKAWREMREATGG
jgi:hypothetical protein